MVISMPPELAKAVDDRWQSLGFKDRSAYIRSLVEADLTVEKDG